MFTLSDTAEQEVKNIGSDYSEELGYDRTDKDLKNLEFEDLLEKLKQSKDLHSLRKQWFPTLFKVCVVWLLLILAVIISAGWCPACKLADSVLIALATTTTINVLGMFIIAARWLFPCENKSNR